MSAAERKNLDEKKKRQETTKEQHYNGKKSEEFFEEVSFRIEYLNTTSPGTFRTQF